MPCYYPLVAVQTGVVAKTGKKVLKILKGVQYDGNKHKDESIIPLPCGQCIGCRLERSRQWAVRCVFEASLYLDNCFITLTFNNRYLNINNSLDEPSNSRFQRFMKRLRKFADTHVYDYSKRKYIKRDIPLSKQGLIHKIRFFHCGEYGQLCKVCGKHRELCWKLQKKGKLSHHRFVPVLGRPHHHACLFNFDFADKELWSVRDGVRLYRSEQLEKLWSDPDTHEPYGFCTVGEVTFESAAYVARYITKKITGGEADEHYKGRVPEYVTMSRRPGIAKEWFDQYKDSDVYASDMVVVRDNIKCKPPKYFDKLFDEIDHDRYTSIKEKRIEQAKKNPDNGLDRLKVRQKVKESKIKHLVRTLETS